MQQVFLDASQAAQQAVSWVERNRDLENDLNASADLIEEVLAKSITRLSNSARNLKHRPTIALFGASQAGKSYLVSSLAAGVNQVLKTTWGQDEINFIRHVNPSGNNSEATGFVTRFTHGKSNKVDGFPIKLRLLTELELVMILVNAYYNDINQADIRPTVSEDQLLDHLKHCEKWVDKEAQSQAKQLSPYDDNDNSKKDICANILTKMYITPYRNVKANGASESNYIAIEHIVEFVQYVSANSNGKLGDFNDLPNFWHKLMHMLPFMPLDGRVEALSILWQKLPIFNETYRTLARELLKLEGNSVIYVPIEAFVNRDGDKLVQNASGTIMHITKLSSMFKDHDELECCFVGNAKLCDAIMSNMLAAGAVLEDQDLEHFEIPPRLYSKANINISRLAALALELNFELENGGPIDDFDVLDMPGARSRDVVLLKDVIEDGATFTPNPQDPLSAINAAMQLRGSEFFRRGKVAYLFDRYARSDEIEQLLFCIGVNVQQDVTSVLTILSDWIEENVGSTPQQRAIGYNPLTIVLTRYDDVFNRQLKNISNGLPLDMNQELNIALNRIQKLNWFNEWTPGMPFKRVMIARRPNLGDIDPWLEYDPKTLVELALKPQYQENIATIKQALLGVDDFAQHFDDFSESLDAVLSLNDGGITKIAQSIKHNSLNAETRSQMRKQKSSALVKQCLELLNPFATRDSASLQIQAQKEAKAVAMNLLQCNSICPCFYMFRALLELDSSLLEQIYQDGFASGSNAQRFVHNVFQAYLDNITPLTKTDSPKINDIATLIAQAYEKSYPNIASDPNAKVLYPFFYNEEQGALKTPDALKDDVIRLFNKIFVEITKTFTSKQVGLADYMVTQLKKHENVNESFDDILKVQVNTVMLMLSDFNMYLGTNLIPSSQDKSSQQQEIKQTSQQLASVTSPKMIVNTPAQDLDGGVNDFNVDDFSDFVGFDDGNDFDVAPGVSILTPSPVAKAPAFNMFEQSQAVENALTTKGKDLPTQSVLGSTEGPCNVFAHKNNVVYIDPDVKNYQVFNYKCKVDDTNLLPHLDEQSADFAFRLVSDFCATLMYIICNVNIMVDSKYKFSAEDNLLLCRILTTMEACE